MLSILGNPRLASAQGISPARQRLLEALRESARVGEDLIAAYRSADRVPVVISLDVPRRGMLARGVRRDRIRDRGAQVLADCPPEDFSLRHRFEHAPGIAGTLHLRAVLRLLGNPAVHFIGLDGGGGGTIAEAMSLTGGYTSLTAGYSGAGGTSAILDSGIDSDHQAFLAAVVDEHCICPGCCPGGGDTQTGPGSAADDNGHGSLVSGVLLSRGTPLSSVGMAPSAGVVAVKVLDDQLVFQQTSDVIAALAWVRDNYTTVPPGLSTVRVVNMSLATTATFVGSCDGQAGSVGLLSDVVDDLVDRGVVVVAAAGNLGDTTALPAPACLSNVLSVGAVWDEDVGEQTFDLPGFSCTDMTTAPDQITCFSNAPANTDVFAVGGLVFGPIFAGALGVSRGTSFASPAVAGCAALLLEDDPMRTPAEVMSLLLASPTLVTDPVTTFSFPRLDCGAALGLGPGDDDSDFDGITVSEGDNCPSVSNTTQADVEIDGAGDRCDVCPFVVDPAQLDTDENGTGDACECIGRDHWPGDVDLSGLVDATDLFILEFNFGDTGVTPTQGDQNCDDVIDGADYTLYADHVGRSNTEIDLSP